MKKDVAIFTIVKNEPYFLPKWIKYYSQFFDKCDMSVLDDATNDGSTDNLDIDVVKLPIRSKLDYGQNGFYIRERFAQLLERYHYVFCTDVDEFITPTHSPNLRMYIDNEISTDRNCFIATGWIIVHYPEKGDVAFDYTKPILNQRQNVNDSPPYNKPYGANYVLSYNIGQHTASNEQPYSQEQRSDPNVILIHAKLFDMDFSINRYRHTFRTYDTILPTVPTIEKDFVLHGEDAEFIKYHYTQRFNGTVRNLDKLLYFDFKNMF